MDSINIKGRIYFAILALLMVLISCKTDEPKSSENNILTFSVEQQIGQAVISTADTLVTAIVEKTVDLTNLAAQIVVSNKASIVPAPAEPQNFTKPVIYVVTAENGDVKKWKAIVGYQPSSDKDILTFTLNEQYKTPKIYADSIVVIVNENADIKNLTPTIEVSAGATVEPASGQAVDFSSGVVIYTVTAQDLSTKQYRVLLTKRASSKADILLFKVEGQIGETYFNEKKIRCMVGPDANLTSIVPVIEVSDKARVQPESGKPVDFSKGAVTFTVFSELGSYQNYLAEVGYSINEPDNPLFKYVGRFDFTDVKRPRVHAPGAYVFFKFKGTYVEVEVYDQQQWGNQNYLEIIIDGKRERIQTQYKKNTLRYDGLADTEHTFMLVKDTEAGIGYIEFGGARCDQLIAPGDLPTRKLEFIGNSITCGTGADLSAVACGAGNWFDQHNAYMSYGPRVARSLNAQWHLSSVSGIGLVHSCCDMGYVISNVFDKTSLLNGSANWDFIRYIPDAVCITLGQNDGVQDSTVFCTAYVNFIKFIRTKYPDAHVICLTSPMDGGSLSAALAKYGQAVAGYFNANGDAKVHYYAYTRGWNSGCDTHPNLDEHAEIAAELEVKLKQVLGW